MTRPFRLLAALALLAAAALLAPPELVLPAGERTPFPRLPKDRFERAAPADSRGPGRNLFLLDPPAPATPPPPPRPIPVKSVPPAEKAALEARRLEATRRVSGRFTLLGWHAASDRSAGRAFLDEGGTIHIALLGGTLLDRYRLESIGTASVMLRDLTVDRLEEVRVQKP